MNGGWTRHQVSLALAVAALATGLVLAPGAVSSVGRSGGTAPGFPAGTVTTTFGLKSDDKPSALVVQPDGRLVVAGTRVAVPARCRTRSCTVPVPESDFVLARYAADGALDPGFGTGGKVTNTFGSGTGYTPEASAVALQPDGKIVVAGTECRPGEDCVHNAGAAAHELALARYNADGTLDASFGSGGKLTTQVGKSNGAAGVAVQPDGKVVVVGFAVPPVGCECGQYAVVRYAADGTLDASFGSDGKVITTFDATTGAAARAVAFQRDGKIVVAGGWGSSANSSPKFALARYNTDGTLDTGFGSGGKVTTTIGSCAAQALALQADGKVVLAAQSLNNASNSNYDFALARFTADGSLDQSFGSGGTVTTDFEPYDWLSAVASQPDGKIVAAGSSQPGASLPSNFALARYNSDGSPDQSFGSGGKMTTALGPRSSEARAVALQPDGKIVAAGTSSTCTNVDFTLARYDANGTLDAGFGSGNTHCIVPNVKGYKLAAANRAVTRRDCSVFQVNWTFSRKAPKGRVISQRPKAGAQCVSDMVSLTVSKGKKKPAKEVGR
jgi:uncharacterized delta-60 repeat protein